jgi:hypothetical protein
MRFLREATFDCSNFVKVELLPSYAAFAASSAFLFTTSSPTKSALSSYEAARDSRFATSLVKRATSSPFF